MSEDLDNLVARVSGDVNRNGHPHADTVAEIVAHARALERDNGLLRTAVEELGMTSLQFCDHWYYRAKRRKDQMDDSGAKRCSEVYQDFAKVYLGARSALKDIQERVQSHE